MARGKASSSDKLLEMIRGKGSQKGEQDTAVESTVQETPAGKKSGLPSKKGAAKTKAPKSKGKPGKTPKLSSGASVKGGSGKTVVVGVDLGPDSLRLSKTTGPVSKRKLLGFKRIPYDPSTPPGSAGFANFLRDKLKEFTKGNRQVQVWTLISSARAELWNINIPKVPRKQITDAVFWSVKKEKQFDENEFILDFDVLGEVAEKGVPKLAVTVYLAPRKQVDEISELFSSAGYKLHGITIAPIAIQTLFRTNWLSTKANTYANLYVGRNWSRIDIFSKGNLVLSRGIKAGTNSMVESLMENYNAEFGGGFSIDQTMVQDEPVISMGLDDDSLIIDEATTRGAGGGSGMDLEQAKQVLVGKLLGGELAPSSPGSELDESQVVEMVLPAAERLVRQIERTFEFHSTTMGNEPVEQIYFSGAICTNKMILQYMYSQLGIESLILDPLNPENPNLGRIQGPSSVVDRMEYNLVVALSLSDNSITPNLIYTYKSKEKQRQALNVDKAIYAVTIMLLAILAGVWMWQQSIISDSLGELQMVENQLQAYNPPATEELLQQMAEKVAQQQQNLKKASLRYESLAVLSEISRITPKYVKLMSVTMDMGPYVEPLPPEPEDPKKKNTRQNTHENETDKIVIMDGFIEGEDIDKFESAFTSYLIRLENSPLFLMPEINKQEKEEFRNRGTVLRFIIHIKVV